MTDYTYSAHNQVPFDWLYEAHTCACKGFKRITAIKSIVSFIAYQ